MLITKTYTNFTSLPITEKTFYISLFFTNFLGIYLTFYGSIYSLLPLTISIFTFITTILILLYSGNSFFKQILTYILYVILAIHLPLFFLATARSNINRPLYDETLLKIDTFLLGWLWKKGQMGLYLDTSPTLNPTTQLGIFIGDVLQIFYFMYYIIPYCCIYLYQLVKCIKTTVHYYKHNTEHVNHKKHWNDLYFMTTVYVFTYFQIFFINSLFPAISPRLYLEHEYQNKLELTGLSGWIHKTFRDNNSANSFPSGHVAESLCVSLALFRMGSYAFGSVILICSLLIATATLFLRYHYAVDCLFGFIIAGVSFAIGCFTYEKITDSDDEQLHESKQAKSSSLQHTSTSTTEEEKYLFSNDEADV